MSEREFVVEGRTDRSIDDDPARSRELVTRTPTDGTSTTFRVDGRTDRSIDEVPEPHRSGMRAAFTSPNADDLPDEPAILDRRMLVRPAHISSRAKLILGFLLVDAAITGGVIWWLTS